MAAGKHWAPKVSFQIQIIPKKSAVNPEEAPREARGNLLFPPVIIHCRKRVELFLCLLGGRVEAADSRTKGSTLVVLSHRICKKQALREAFQLKVTSIVKKCHASK